MTFFEIAIIILFIVKTLRPLWRNWWFKCLQVSMGSITKENISNQKLSVKGDLACSPLNSVFQGTEDSVKG